MTLLLIYGRCSMEIKELKTLILKNTIPNVLIFIGEEQALTRQYFEKLTTTLNKYHKFYDTADAVLYDVTTNLRDDYLFIVLNDNSILKNFDNYMVELQKTGRNIVLYYTDFDKKSEICKKYKDILVDFKKQDKYTLVAYLMKYLDNNKISLDQKHVENLVEKCDCSLGICLNEVDKIITLGQTKSDLVFEYMLSNGFPDYRKVNVYDFLYKILCKSSTAFEMYQKIDESVIGMLTLLYNQASNKLASTNNMFYANIMQLCSQLDSGIKDGTISDKYVMDYLMLKVL